MTQIRLHEAGGSRIKPREGKGDKYRARVMGWEPGAEFVEGSSAWYPVAVIRRDFAEAFPSGTRMRANHDGFCEMGGDIKRIAAKTTSIPTSEADGMYADIYVGEEWSTFAREFADVIGLSISAAAAVEMAEVEGEDGEPVMRPVLRDGKPIVERFLTAEESPYNAIDLVEAPGADGRITKAIESAVKTYEGMDIRHQANFAEGLPQIHRILQEEAAEKKSETAPSRHTQEGTKMDTELQTFLEGMEARITADTASRITEALKPTEAPAPKVSTKDVAEAVSAAGLSDVGAAVVYEAHDNDEDYKPVLERELKREKSILESHSKRTPKVQSGQTSLVGESGGDPLAFLDAPYQESAAGGDVDLSFLDSKAGV